MAADTRAANLEDFCGRAGTAMRKELVIKSYAGAITKCWKGDEVPFHNSDTLRSVWLWWQADIWLDTLAAIKKNNNKKKERKKNSS